MPLVTFLTGTCITYNVTGSLIFVSLSVGGLIVHCVCHTDSCTFCLSLTHTHNVRAHTYTLPLSTIFSHLIYPHTHTDSSFSREHSIKLTMTWEENTGGAQAIVCSRCPPIDTEVQIGVAAIAPRAVNDVWVGGLHLGWTRLCQRAQGCDVDVLVLSRRHCSHIRHNNNFLL